MTIVVSVAPRCSHLAGTLVVGCRCSTAKTGTPKADLCKEVGELRETVTEQGARLVEQEQRIVRLEAALQVLLEK